MPATTLLSRRRLCTPGSSSGAAGHCHCLQRGQRLLATQTHMCFPSPLDHQTFNCFTVLEKMHIDAPGCASAKECTGAASDLPDQQVTRALVLQ